MQEIRGVLLDIDGVLHVNLYWKTSDGMRLDSVLVCSGKHRADSPLLAYVHPDAILPSIADLPEWLELH